MITSVYHEQSFLNFNWITKYILFYFVNRRSNSFLFVWLQILRDLGVRTMKLMTNNPTKFIGLKGYGLEVSGRVPLVTPVTKDNKRYLETKRAKMGHVYNFDLGVRFRNLIDDHKKSNENVEPSNVVN